MKSAGFQFELLYAAVAFLLLLNRQCEKKKKKVVKLHSALNFNFFDCLLQDNR